MNERMPQGKETVSDQQIITAIEEHDDPVVSSKEVAELFDHTRQWAHRRLNRLSDDGLVEKKESGGQSVVWWVK